MTLDLIKAQIAALPDVEIRPLLEWMRDYYDGPVWDRQIDSDAVRLGPSEFMRRFGSGADS